MSFLEDVRQRTNTSLFLVRGVGLHKAQLDKYGFINGYRDDLYHEPHYENAVYCLYKPPDFSAFELFLHQEKLRSKDILEDYDYADGYIVVVYRFPKQYLRELEHFENGEFSKFRKTYQSLFPQEREIKNLLGNVIRKEANLYHMVFNKASELKQQWERELGVELSDDAEVWTRPSKEKETLNIELIRKSNEPA